MNQPRYYVSLYRSVECESCEDDEAVDFLVKEESNDGKSILALLYATAAAIAPESEWVESDGGRVASFSRVEDGEEVTYVMTCHDREAAFA